MSETEYRNYPGKMPTANYLHNLHNPVTSKVTLLVLSSPETTANVLEGDSIAERFDKLVSEWKRDTMFESSITNISLHPSYQQIIGMGLRAIPYILDQLAKNSGQWFWALKSITGYDPVPQMDRGDVKKMSLAWLEWGKKEGYINR